MNKQAKQLWIDALRSGKYNQGMHNLNYKDNYCCLGVLCEVYLKNCPNPKINKTVGSLGISIYGSYSSLLPFEVKKWANLQDQIYFTYLNDTLNKSFSEIADYIEENC